MPRSNKLPPLWPKADEEMAAALWKAGKTGGEISAEFGGKYSRTSVIGKMNRMGLARDPVLPKPVPVPEKRERKVRPNHVPEIIERHRKGQRPSEIANLLRLETTKVVAILVSKGFDPRENMREKYKVHPMWSMPEDERRVAFYEKFCEGWKGVQERLNAGR